MNNLANNFTGISTAHLSSYLTAVLVIVFLAAVVAVFVGIRKAAGKADEKLGTTDTPVRHLFKQVFSGKEAD
jgi:hypothetical protein